MKKFTPKKSEKTVGIVLLIGGLFLLILGLIILLAADWKTLLHYGWKWLSEDEQTSFGSAIFMLLMAPFAVANGLSTWRRFICLTDEKVYGDMGLGFRSKPVELLYSEILAAKVRGGGVMLETVKGSFGFSRMESPEEIAALINEKCAYNG